MSPRVSPLDNDTCRQCTSFADYMKENKKKFEEVKEEDLMCQADNPGECPIKPRREDCPLDKDELGNKTWGFLHTMAAKYPKEPTCEDKHDVKEFFRIFSKFYPCDHCAEEIRDQIKLEPPITKSQDALSQWLCRLHNKINVKLGKPEFDCSKVDERWRDGWKDGSCDF